MDKDDSIFHEDHGPHTGAAAMVRMAKKNPQQVLGELEKANPHADPARLFSLWWPIMQADDEYLEAVGFHSFTNLLNAIHRDKRKTKSRRNRHKKEQEALKEFYKQTMIRKVVLMELTLPNGKKLRDATFAECSAAGGWFKSLAVKGKPSEIVGKTLTEQDLQKHRAGK